VKVSVKDVNSYRKLLTIEVPLEEVKKAFDDVYREIGSSANIPGFRKGKIPRNIVEAHYKSEARNEVLKRIVPESYSKAVGEKKLNPVLPPVVDKVSFDPDKPLSFEAQVDVRPEIKLPKYKGIEIEIKKSDVKDSDVDAAMKNLQERNATFEPVTGRGIEPGDFAMLDHEIIVDGKAVDTGKDLLWDIKDDGYFPNMATGLKGAKAGDARDIETTLPKEYKKGEFGGKKAVIKATVKEIKVKKLPELNDEFVKELGGGIKDIAELKGKVREELTRYSDDVKRMQKEGKINEFLVKKTSFEVSPELVEKQIDFLIKDENERHKYHAATEKTGEAKRREALKEQAANQVKLYFIFETIAEAEKIEATEAEVDERIKGIAARLGKNYFEVKKFFVAEGKVDTLRDKIREDKVVKFLIEQAKITEK